MACRRLDRLAALLVATATLALMIATEPRLAIVWDEGFTLIRLARVRAWLRALPDPAGAAASWRPAAIAPAVEDAVPPPSASEVDSRSELFAPRVLAWFWPFAREEPHGHPPFYAFVALAGDLVTPGRDVLSRARLGAMVAFSLTAGAIFCFLAEHRGTRAAALGSGAWVFQPQLFGLGHYAHYDALLASLWVGATFAFARAVLTKEEEVSPRSPNWGWVVLFGILAGWAAGTKFTGWLLPLPFLAWSSLYRDRRGVLTVLVGGLVAALTVYIFTPPWWGEPITGVSRFLRSNLTRGQTTPIPTLFLGRIYETPTGSLPWYNTLVWTLLATPAGFLVLAMLGAASALVRKGDRLATLAATQWAFLLLLRALPHTPGHDGIRQFLPAFGCLALCCGLGTAWVVSRLGQWAKGFALLALAEGVISTALAMPVPLSYFSPVVGGLPGAARLGMEPTYYWDALTPEALRWINEHTGPRRTVLFSATPASYFYLKQAGRLRPGAFPYDARPWEWYLLQNRPGVMDDLDRALIARSGPRRVLVSHQGVPLLWAFPRSEFEAAERSRKTAP
jgi:hypothetical protein